MINNVSYPMFRGYLGFCSNFHPCKIIYEGVEFQDSETAFQWAKCKEKSDQEKIAASNSPAEAKKIGQKVTLIDNWDVEKIRIMEEILNIKFTNPKMKKRLLSTNDLQLIEYNYWKDAEWGMCQNDKGEWVGKNHLGRILMKIRDKLKNE